MLNGVRQNLLEEPSSIGRLEALAESVRLIWMGWYEKAVETFTKALQGIRHVLSWIYVIMAPIRIDKGRSRISIQRAQEIIYLLDVGLFVEYG